MSIQTKHRGVLLRLVTEKTNGHLWGIGVEVVLVEPLVDGRPFRSFRPLIEGYRRWSHTGTGIVEFPLQESTGNKVGLVILVSQYRRQGPSDPKSWFILDPREF